MTSEEKQNQILQTIGIPSLHVHACFNEFHSGLFLLLHVQLLNNRIPPLLMRRRRRLITWQIARLLLCREPPPNISTMANHADRRPDGSLAVRGNVAPPLSLGRH